MRSVTATWTGSKLGFGIGSERLPTVHINVDEPAPLGHDLGLMPTELLLGALGACVGMNATALLQKRKLPLAGVAVHVSGEQSTEWPKQFTAIEIVFELAWSAEPDYALADTMLDKAVHSYCPVGGTLSPTVSLTITRRDVVSVG